MSDQFQSSPAPKDGRYPGRMGQAASLFGFNPRPPRRTGATSCGYSALHFRHCFNPRPPRRTGATIAPRERAAMLQFQSSPAPKDGRYQACSGSVIPVNSFQSSPAPKDGRYPKPHPSPHSSQAFQSSPAPKDGRYGRRWR